MALSVKGDHHSLPFRGWAYIWEAVHLGLRLMEQHYVTPFNYDPPPTPLLPGLTVCRLAKEEILYKSETSQQEQKIERMKEEAADEYDIKKQVRRSSLKRLNSRCACLHSEICAELSSASQLPTEGAFLF